MAKKLRVTLSSADFEKLVSGKPVLKTLEGPAVKNKQIESHRLEIVLADIGVAQAGQLMMASLLKGGPGLVSIIQQELAKRGLG